MAKDMGSRARKRIEDVRILRSYQFPEDAEQKPSPRARGKVSLPTAGFRPQWIKLLCLSCAALLKWTKRLVFQQELRA